LKYEAYTCDARYADEKYTDNHTTGS
jgi:hypothetical protein